MREPFLLIFELSYISFVHKLCGPCHRCEPFFGAKWITLIAYFWRIRQEEKCDLSTEVQTPIVLPLVHIWQYIYVKVLPLHRKNVNTLLCSMSFFFLHYLSKLGICNNLFLTELKDFLYDTGTFDLLTTYPWTTKDTKSRQSRVRKSSLIS